MTPNRSKIIDQIRKLMEITNPDSGAFEGEMANASAAMQRLMDKYSIDMVEVHEADNVVVDEAFGTKNADAMFGVIKQWHWHLARIIGRITHTKHFSTAKHSESDTPMKTAYGYERTWGKTIGFYGKESNAEVASQLFVEWLNKLTVMAMVATGEYCKILCSGYGVASAYRISGLGEDHPNVWRASWLKGCLRTIENSPIDQEQERTEKIESALVLYDENLAAKWLEHSKGFRTISFGDNAFNVAGYHSGSEVGATLHIGQKAVTGRNKQLSD